jgi:hypothetical protein
MNELTHFRIVNALTSYDRKASTRKFHNPYALGQYFQALECAEAQVDGGATLRDALVKNFCGRLLDVVLRSVGEQVSTKQECRS